MEHRLHVWPKRAGNEQERGRARFSLDPDLFSSTSCLLHLLYFMNHVLKVLNVVFKSETNSTSGRVAFSHHVYMGRWEALLHLFAL